MTMEKPEDKADHLVRNGIQDSKQVLTTECLGCNCQPKLLAWMKNIDSGYNLLKGKEDEST